MPSVLKGHGLKARTPEIEQMNEIENFRTDYRNRVYSWPQPLIDRLEVAEKYLALSWWICSIRALVGEIEIESPKQILDWLRELESKWVLEEVEMKEMLDSKLAEIRFNREDDFSVGLRNLFIAKFNSFNHYRLYRRHLSWSVRIIGECELVQEIDFNPAIRQFQRLI